MGRRVDMRDVFSRDPLPVFSADGYRQQFWPRRGPLFDVVHQAFPLPTMASTTLKGTLEDGFGDAVVTRVFFAPTMRHSVRMSSCQT